MNERALAEKAVSVRVSQDLHVHTVFSRTDGAIVPQQTLDLIKAVRHAEVIGISDHFEQVQDMALYEKSVRAHGFHFGLELNGPEWVADAAQVGADYYVYHCPDRRDAYRQAERLLATGKPVIIAHPNVMQTNLGCVPPDCLIEINNRYVWQTDWAKCYGDHTKSFRFVISSDSHQPSWLNQNVARYVAERLGVTETLLFPCEGEMQELRAAGTASANR